MLKADKRNNSSETWNVQQMGENKLMRTHLRKTISRSIGKISNGYGFIKLLIG